MNKTQLNRILKDGENSKLEFKENFTKEVIETLVAFANTKGGKVFIGISDIGLIKGVNIKKETLKNWINEIKTKTQPFLLPDVQEIKYKDNIIIIFEIDEFPLKPVAFNDKIYKRNNNMNQKCSITELQDGFNIEVFSKKLNGTLNGTLNQELELVLNLISDKLGIKAYTIAEALKRPIDTLKKQIKKLVDMNLIERRVLEKQGVIL